MTANRILFALATVCLGSFLVSACGGQQQGGSAARGLPDWVTGSCESYWGDRTDILCGLGVVSPTAGATRDVMMMQGFDRAQLAVGQQLDSFLQRVSEETIRRGTDTSAAGDNSFQLGVSRLTSRVSTQIRASGIRRYATHFGDDGTIYVLAGYEAGGMRDLVNSITDENERVREELMRTLEEDLEHMDEVLEEQSQE